MSIPEIETKVRASIVESFLEESAAGSLRNDDDLLMVLDSLQLLRLVIAIESMFSIKVEQSELNGENLGSVQKIATFVAGKPGVNGQKADEQ